MKPPPPPPNATLGKVVGKTNGKAVVDDLAQGDDDTISANRFREQDELRCRIEGVCALKNCNIWFQIQSAQRRGLSALGPSYLHSYRQPNPPLAQPVTPLSQHHHARSTLPP